MSELVFECDPALDIRRRTFWMLVLAGTLWAVVTVYQPWAAVGFIAVAIYFVRLHRVPKMLWIEVSLTAFDCRVRRRGEDEWTRLKRMPSTWGSGVVMSVPEAVVPFGMLWLTEPLLGAALFRQLRSMVRSAGASS